MSDIETLRKDIVAFNLSLKAIIQDIAQCSGPMEELNELNRQGRVLINRIKDSIGRTEMLANEETQANQQMALQLEAKNYKEELRETMAVFKKVNVESMLNLAKSNREELLGRDDEKLVRHRKNKDKEDLVGLSSNVTERLLSISRNLAETTERSSETLGTLITSSNTVDTIRGELDSQGSVITQSDKILAKYGRREQTDKFLILLASAFFFACVFYILRMRLF